MRTEIKHNFSYNKTLLILSILCIASACLSMVLGELAVVAVSALLSAIFVFESGKKRIFSFVLPVLVVAINLLTILFLGFAFSIWSVVSILAAFVIYYGYVKGLPKFDTALIVTGIVAIFSVISLLIVGMISVGQFSISASLEFYNKLYMVIRDEFSTTLVELYSQISQGIEVHPITYDDAASVIDAMVSLLIAVLVIVSFGVAGLCYKCFGVVMDRCAEYREEIREWRFLPPAFFGHFYLVLVVAYFILSNGDGILAISVTNLYLIFMWMYAYVGLRIAYIHLSKVRSKGFAIIMLVLALFLLASFAMQILAMLGAFYTSRQNNEISSGN